MPDTVMIPETTSNLIVQGPRQRSAQWGDLMVALAKAQGEIEGAKKDSQNPHFKSSYADLASVWAAIREPLSKHGLAVMQWPRVSEGAVEIETIVAHGEQFISDVLWMPCGKMDAHGIGSAITYGRRYALMAVAGVAPEDDDGNGAVEGHRPGIPGSAGAGGQFRPTRRGGSDWVGDAQRDGIVDTTREKGKLPVKDASKLTKAEEKAAKVKAATDKRVDLLKSQSTWTRAALDQFWTDNSEWIDWMSDPTNAVLPEYERFSVAFADAETRIQTVELA